MNTSVALQDHPLSAVAASARDIAASSGARALRAAAALWFGIAAVGQLLFASYVVVFYGRAALTGHPEQWNQILSPGYVPGDGAGNTVLASHLAFGAAVTLAGAFQLVPAVRRRWPRFHRWNGRVFVLSAIVAALGGLVMVATRASGGDASQHAAIALSALVILFCAGAAWRQALARRFDAHRQWALRLYLVANGGWFFRIGLMAWIVLNRGPAGFDPKTFTGPFLTFLGFAQYLVPLALLQLYFIAQRRSAATQGAMAAAVFALALLTAVGVAAATALLWLPHFRPTA